MNLLPHEEIGSEIHPHTSQFIRVESGSGTAVIAGKKYRLKNSDALLVPSGTKHNVITIYSPPHHPVDTIEEFKN